VQERFEKREALTLAALRASGLSAPFGGLVDLYQNGKFAPCGANDYLPPQKPGEVLKHSELSGTAKVALLHDAPKEYRGGWAQNAPRVPEPTITAQFRDSHTAVTTTASPEKGTLHQANYDYKARGFTVPGETKAGAGGPPVIVARMNSYGAVSAPTGRNSSPAAVPGLSHASHSSGGFSGSFGGSASHSSGGGASDSSGGGGWSSGGGAAHSSGGGGGSAASSASSAGAGSHH
jgi:hypothetical protein